ncbi:hypothetical protein ScPMuIL_016966 [Solemya velum]
MCDFDQREISALEKLFEDSDKSQGVIRTYEYGVRVLKDSNAYRTRSFRNWIEKCWLPEHKRWVRCYREDLINIKVNTTNGLERLHRVFKEGFLKKMGFGGTLVSMLTVLVKNFCPESEKKTPQGLCVKSGDSDEIYELQMRFQIPKCTCENYKSSHWPCKHMLAVIVSLPEYRWDSLPKTYTSLPCFVLDMGLICDEAPTQDGTTQEQQEPSPSEGSEDDLRDDNLFKVSLGLLKNVETGLYGPMSSETLSLAVIKLKELDALLSEQFDVKSISIYTVFLESRIDDVNEKVDDVIHEVNNDLNEVINDDPNEQKPCRFCNHIITGGKFKRHMMRLHAKEERVKDTAQKPKSMQNKLFDELHTEGIYAYNIKHLSDSSVKEDSLMRERRVKYTDSLRMCTVHQDKEFMADLLNNFRETDVGNLCRSDEIIQQKYSEPTNPSGMEDKIQALMLLQLPLQGLDALS